MPRSNALLYTIKTKPEGKINNNISKKHIFPITSCDFNHMTLICPILTIKNRLLTLFVCILGTD